MISRALPILVLTALLLTQPIAGHHATQTASSTSPAPIVIPFELANRHIILKVQVNHSRPLAFVLDTGDQFAIIDLERANELKLELGGEISMGGAGAALSSGSFVRETSFTIPGFNGFSQPVTLALPIARMSRGLGQDFDGIIGSDFIKEYVLELDYQARVIKLHDKNTFQYTGPGESIPIQLNHGHPILTASVTPLGGAPIEGKFVLDIGSGAALALYSPFVAKHELLGSNLKTIKAFGAGAGGDIAGQVGRTAELKLGKFKIANPVTLFSQDKEGAFASASLAGNIGAQIVNKFKIFLDYSHARIILEPNSTFAEPFDRSISGARLQAEGKDFRTFRIKTLLENSPASEAGLQEGDIISAIDGKPASAFTLTSVNELFERPAAYKLTVQRGEQVLKVILKPRKLI